MDPKLLDEGARLRRLRRDPFEFTLAMVADRAQCAAATVVAVERGRAKHSTVARIRLAVLALREERERAAGPERRA